VTEGNGHVIDPNGDARRALQEAVAEHGPEVLSNAGVMENVCRDHLAGLPGESILIGDATRTDVPALLGDLIPQLGNYGAIQSAAATLAGEHSLDMAASLWVVREFARALGYIAPATGTAAAFPGSGPRPVPGSGPRPVASSGPRPVSGSGPRPVPGSGPRPVPGSGLPPDAGSAERPVGTGEGTGAAEGSGTVGAGSEEGENVRPGGGEAGRAVAGGAAAGAAAAGVAADEAGRGEGGGGEAAAGGPGTGGPGTREPGASGATGSGAAGTSGASVGGTGASGVSGGSATTASGGTGQASGSPENTGPAFGSPGATGTADGGTGAAGLAAGGPGATGPAVGGLGTGLAAGGAGATGPVGGGGGGPVSTGPMRDVSGASGPAAGGAWGGPSVPGGTSGSGTGGAGTGGAGGWSGGTGGAAPEGEPGFPLPLPAGRLPGRQSQRSKLLNRNTVGIAAAVALIAGYLGVAAAAHLSPFPAKAVPTVSASQSSSPPVSTSSSPASSPDPSADPSPSSQLDILLTKIPTGVRGTGDCLNAGTGSGATAVIQCQKLQGLGANVIVYYLYPNKTALASGLSSFLKAATFSKRRECTTNGSFRDFIVDCQSDFVIKTPGMTGSIAEYVNKTASQNPIIVSTDNEQNVMAVLVGTNDGDLLAYWNKQEWVVTP
jgi:hypothetical protein